LDAVLSGDEQKSSFGSRLARKRELGVPVHAFSGAGAGIARTAGSQSLQFIATNGPERFARVGSRFLGRTIEARRIELIDL
jgi:hypothetical protein